MCDLNEGFKLCSCDAELLKHEELDWYLDRVNPKLPLQHRKGRAAIPRYSTEQEVCLEEILKQLNNRNCFDFEYQPVKDDRLSVKVQDKWFAYRYSGKSWGQDFSTSLEAWRSQLERHKEGKLD